MRAPFLLALTLALAAVDVAAAPAPAPDDKYYEFWPGTWCEIVNGKADPKATCFESKRGANAAAFEESWTQMIDGKPARSRGLRAWDPIEKRWMFVWTSAEGHFQIWRGEKVGNDWYIARAFDQGGQKFLSRQAWVPSAGGTVTRIMERSFDDGKTWQPRYRAELGRVSGPP